jgi:O-antigen ligase
MLAASSIPAATPFQARLQRIAINLYTFLLSAAAATEPMYAAIAEKYNPVRQGAVLTLLLILHLLVRPWLLFTRELAIYSVFTAYMWLTLIWTPANSEASVNTLIPAVDFILIALLFGSLIAFHNLRAVLTGALAGVLAGAAAYTLATGFPFHYPDELSYNAIAGMYLMSLFITLIYGWYTRSRLLPVILGLVLMVHIAITTSIKTNLGIVLGAGAAAIFYARTFFSLLLRHILLLIIFAVAIAYAVISNPDLLERANTGLDRVSRGVEILQRREDLEGHTSFGERTDWQARGIKGWVRSPLFGNGVEAFRFDNGITSHSTPIDLLYNFGVVGLLLFYALFASIAWRLMTLRNKTLGSLPALIFAGLNCYGFITLSGTVHYNAFFAVYFSISFGLLRRFEDPVTGDRRL